MIRTPLSHLSFLILLASACSFDTSGVVPGTLVDASVDAPMGPDDGGPGTDALITPDAAMPADAFVPPAPAVIGYWRMDVDLDVGPALRIANQENGGQPPLTAPSPAFLSSDVPVFMIPGTGDVNLASLAQQAAFLDGSIAHQSQFDVRSIGVEFWARNTDAAATFFDRSTDILSNGVRIDSPSNLRVRYHVEDGAGGSTPVVLIPGGVVVDATWRHYAFIYDETTGMGCVYVDGSLRGSCDNGPDNRALVWAPNTPIAIGRDINGEGVAGAVIDELRVWDGAPQPSDLLVVQP